MTYETKSGARYWVDEYPSCSLRVTWCIYRKLSGYVYSARFRGIPYSFTDRASAEAALKAYADAHRWKVVEG
jgi:hypothetical protein